MVTDQSQLKRRNRVFFIVSRAVKKNRYIYWELLYLNKKEIFKANSAYCVLLLLLHTNWEFKFSFR